MKNDVKVGLVIGLVFVTALIVFLARQSQTDTEVPQLPRDDALSSFRERTDRMKNDLTGTGTVTDTGAATGSSPLTGDTTPVDAGRLMTPEDVDKGAAAGKAADGDRMDEPVDATPAPKARKWLVKRGDTLWSIAEACYGDGRKSNTILAANRQLIGNPDKLPVNITLTIPAPKKDAVLLDIKKTHPDAVTYTVKKGDSLWSIAQKCYGDGRLWPTIARANKLSEGKALREGATIIIPKKPE